MLVKICCEQIEVSEFKIIAVKNCRILMRKGEFYSYIYNNFAFYMLECLHFNKIGQIEVSVQRILSVLDTPKKKKDDRMRKITA